MHNLSEADSVRYVEKVFGNDKPGTLGTWRGAQYFNDGAIGQQITVELIEVPLLEEKKLDEADHLEASRIATAGEVVAAVVVTHEAGRHPESPCEGPN